MWQHLSTVAVRIGWAATDDADTRVRKRLVVSTALVVALAAIIWGAIYWVAGAHIAATIPWGYVVLSSATLIAFGLSRSFMPFLFGQLTIFLLLPFALQLVLGGFINASAVILWSLLAPMVAMVTAGRRRSLWWFGGYAVLVLITELVQPSVQIENVLTTGTKLGFFIMNILGVSAITYFALQYFVGEKDQALDLLGFERAKSERLLLNVLPEEIAAILKDDDQTIADRFPSISVLFADVVDFTPTSERLQPEEVVDLLNEVFSHFDALAERYGCEKIRTVGDSYMVASGVPTPRLDHAQALARMAIDMRDYIAERNGGHNAPLQFRYGMSSGPAVAGVIGKTKFQYDVWGDTVNTASRMESHGVAGRIQMSASAYEVLKDEFVCEPRGAIDVKGKGSMQTWYLEGVR